MQEILEVKNIGLRHPITVRLITHLELGKPGDVLTDEELTEIAGMQCAPQKAGYGYLMSAINYLLTNDGPEWQRDPRQKRIRCLNPTERLIRAKEAIPKIRKISNKNCKRISYISKDLPQEKMQESCALAAQFGAISLLSKNDTVKKLASYNSVPKIGDALKLFENV